MSVNAAKGPAPKSNAPVNVALSVAAKSRKTERTPFVPRSSDPYIDKSVTLLSEPVKRLLDDTSETAQYNFYRFDSTLELSFRKNQRALVKLGIVNTHIANCFTEIELELEKELERLKTLASNVGTQRATQYTHATAVHVRCYSPSYERYVDILSKADLLINHLDGLWLARVVNNSDRNNKIVFWRNRVTRFNREIVNLYSRVTAYAQRTGASLDKDEEVDFGELAPASKKASPNKGGAQLKKQSHKSGKVSTINGSDLAKQEKKPKPDVVAPVVAPKESVVAQAS